MAPSFSVLLVSMLLFWIPGLYSSTQVTNSGTHVSIEAMCSATSAGVKWTDHGIRVIPLELRLTFSCTSSQMTEPDVTEDVCFHKLGHPLINLLQRNRSVSMTHVIAQDFKPETDCTFKGTVFYGYNDEFEVLTASCTVGDPNTVLPANCTSLNDAKECQCSCSPGFSGQADNRIDGNTCEPVPAGEASEVVSPTKTMLGSITAVILATSATGYLTQGVLRTNLLEQTATRATAFSGSPTLSGHSTTSISAMYSRSIPVESIQSTRAVSSHSTPSESIRSTPSEFNRITHAIPHNRTSASLNLSTLAVSNLPTQTDSTELPTLALSIVPGSILVLFISSTLLILGIIVCQKCRLRRLHEKLAVPFPAMKNEKIDPDFNPIKIDERIFVSESMHSIFHTFGSQLESNQKTFTGQSRNTIEPNIYSTDKHSPLNDESGSDIRYVQYDSLFQRANEESFGNDLESTLVHTLDELLYDFDDFSEEEQSETVEPQSPIQQTELDMPSLPVVQEELMEPTQDIASTSYINQGTSNDQKSKYGIEALPVQSNGNKLLLQWTTSGYVVDTSVQRKDSVYDTSNVFFDFPKIDVFDQ